MQYDARLIRTTIGDRLERDDGSFYNSMGGSAALGMSMSSAKNNNTTSLIYKAHQFQQAQYSQR